MSKEFIPTQQDREAVEKLAGYGISQDDICQLIKNPETGYPISRPTLEKNFFYELSSGAVRANERVVGSLFKAATESQNESARVQAAMFWTRMRMGWKDTQVVEHVGKDGRPLDNALTYISEALDQIAARIDGDEDVEASEGGEGRNPREDAA